MTRWVEARRFLQMPNETFRLFRRRSIIAFRMYRRRAAKPRKEDASLLVYCGAVGSFDEYTIGGLAVS